MFLVLLTLSILPSLNEGLEIAPQRLPRVLLSQIVLLSPPPHQTEWEGSALKKLSPLLLSPPQ